MGTKSKKSFLVLIKRTQSTKFPSEPGKKAADQPTRSLVLQTLSNREKKRLSQSRIA
jgi:hypothetical protein